MLQALTPKGFFNAAKAIRKLEAEGLAGDEKVRAQFERDDQLIKALAGSVAYFEPLLRRVIKDCTALAEGREVAP